MAFGPNPPPIQAHICVKGGVDAIAFYKAAFGAECPFHQLADDGRRVLHANIELFGGEVMLHDEFPEYGGDVLSPQSQGGASVAININLPSAGDVDAVVTRAQAAGAVVTMAAQDAFWGSRYARIRDPFGHVWAFNAPLPKAAG
ncbi:MAG: VOC family protein [Pseudomonadota bacterium]